MESAVSKKLEKRNSHLCFGGRTGGWGGFCFGKAAGRTLEIRKKYSLNSHSSGKAKTMPNRASDCLKENVERIMFLWEERARREVGVSTLYDSLVLQNALPLYLSQLVDKLSNRTNKLSNQIAADQVGGTRFGKLHGHDRAGHANYSISQLIFEYHILRQVIFQVLEEEAP